MPMSSSMSYMSFTGFVLVIFQFYISSLLNEDRERFKPVYSIIKLKT
jgi:hypothetical protein